MADYAIPTGSEILSYHGDPGLAAGAGTGLMPIQVNPLAGIDSSLDKIQDLNQKEKLLEYQQKQKDQEDLAKMLSETGGSVFNMKNAQGENVSMPLLPQDKQIVEPAAMELNRLALKNPHNWRFNEDWINKKRRFDSMVTEAGMRTHADSVYNQDMAKATDPEERDNIMAWRKAQLEEHKLGEGRVPEPYLHKADVVDKIAVRNTPEKDYEEFNTTIDHRPDDQGNNIEYKVKTIGKPNSEIEEPRLDMSGAGLSNSMATARSFAKHPDSRNPAAIIRMNQQIDKQAAARGIRPAYAAIIDANGNVQLNSDAREVATALNLEKYKVQEKRDVSDNVLKQAKEQEDILKTRTDREKEQKTIDQMDEELRLKRLKAEQEKASTSKAEYEQRLAEVDAKQKTNTVVRAMREFDNEISSNASAQPVEKVLPGLYADLKDKASFDAKGYKALSIPMTEDLKNMGGEPNVVETKSGEKNMLGSLPPIRQVYLQSPDGKVKNGKIAYEFDTTDPNTESKTKTSRWKIVDAPQAIGNLVSFSGNYHEDKTKQQSMARQYYDDNFGDAPIATQKEAPPAKSAPAAFKPKYNGSEIQVRAVPGGGEALVNGQWRKIVSRNSQTGEITVK